MAIQVPLQHPRHEFTKQNLIGNKDSSDIYKCEYCGLTGKRPAFLDYLLVDGRFSSKAEYCDGRVLEDVPKQIKITRCHAVGAQFANLKPDSIHDVVTPPAQHTDRFPNNKTSVWVMGVGEPVRLLSGEFAPITMS